MAAFSFGLEVEVRLGGLASQHIRRDLIAHAIEKGLCFRGRL